jgi:putative transposase
MTRPRIVDPGATLALSRRTTRRHFLLNPDEARQMEQVYWYCLAYAAKLHGVLVHAACLMSTHSHEVITDVRGQYPKFLQTFHRYLALCTKAYRGWPEEVFNKDSSGAHVLLTPEATLEAIAYLIANPDEERQRLQAHRSRHGRRKDPRAVRKEARASQQRPLHRGQPP